ncbi:hypothetical protein [Pendulispora albinea]|uniref:Uncharacterized protein n=1 Tax=Pendulispora albinea TaxID=2741071 RepID=A0ABZ2M682_9BACT
MANGLLFRRNKRHPPSIDGALFVLGTSTVQLHAQARSGMPMSGDFVDRAPGALNRCSSNFNFTARVLVASNHRRNVPDTIMQAVDARLGILYPNYRSSFLMEKREVCLIAARHVFRCAKRATSNRIKYSPWQLAQWPPAAYAHRQKSAETATL